MTTTRLTGFVARDFDIFAGLDVDKRSIAATFTDHGTMQKSLKLPYSPAHLLNYTEKHFPGQRVAFVYEAGPTGFGLHDELRAANKLCLVVSPSMVPSAPRNKVKTNRLDSKKLSESLRGGQLRGIHVPPQSYRELRHLVQLRDTQVAQLKATKLRIKSLLLYEGIAFPSENGTWSGRVLRQLEQLPCNPTVRFKLDQLIDTLQFHFLAAAKVQKEVRRFCHNDPELRQNIRFLASLPGVGTITATHALARLGDWRQITDVRQIAGFLGLASREHTTGDKEDRGEDYSDRRQAFTQQTDSMCLDRHSQRSGTACFLSPHLSAPTKEGGSSQSDCRRGS